MDEPQPLPWDDASWVRHVESWVALELERLGLESQGTLELVRSRPWAAVARVATAAGDVWFKEPAPSLAFEPALTTAVSSRCPDFAPEVLSTNATWMLTRDAGRQLHGVLKSRDPTPSWDELLRRYAELQIAFTDDVHGLIALGTPDKRPTKLSAEFSHLVERVGALGFLDVTRVRALAPDLDSLTESLTGPLPATLIHEEFHGGNIFVRGGQARLIDWAEAAVSHPFAGIVNTFRDIAFRRRLKPNGREMRRLRSVYLESWTRFATPPELQELFDQGYVLGALCRALTWERVLAGQSASVRAEHGRNAAVWLNVIFREAIEHGVRVGA